MSLGPFTQIVIALTVAAISATGVDAWAGPRNRNGNTHRGPKATGVFGRQERLALLSCLVKTRKQHLDGEVQADWDATRSSVRADQRRDATAEVVRGRVAKLFLRDLLDSEHFLAMTRDEVDHHNSGAAKFDQIDVSGFDLLPSGLQDRLADAIARRMVFELPFLKDPYDLPAREIEAQRLGIPVTEYVTLLRRLRWMMDNDHGPDVIKAVRAKLVDETQGVATRIAALAPRPPSSKLDPAPPGPRPMVAVSDAQAQLAVPTTASPRWRGSSLEDLLASPGAPDVHELDAWASRSFPEVENLFKSPYFAKMFYRATRRLAVSHEKAAELLWAAEVLPEDRATVLLMLENDFLVHLTAEQLELSAGQYGRLIGGLETFRRADPEGLRRLMAWQLLLPSSSTNAHVQRESQKWRRKLWKERYHSFSPPTSPALVAIERATKRHLSSKNPLPYALPSTQYDLAEKTWVRALQALDGQLRKLAPTMNARQYSLAMATSIRQSREFWWWEFHGGHRWADLARVYASHLGNLHLGPEEWNIIASEGINMGSERRVSGATIRSGLREHFPDAPKN